MRRLIEERVMTPIASKIAEDPSFRHRTIYVATESDAPRPDGDTAAPPRFLPFYDNVLLGHADRSRIIPEGGGKWFPPGEGLLVGTILIDGFLAGRWKIQQQQDRATLVIDHFVRLRKQDRGALAREGYELLSFAVPDASHDLRITNLS